MLNFDYVSPPKVSGGDILVFGGGGGGGHIGFSADPVGVSIRHVSALASVLQILVPIISLEPADGIPPNLPGYIIGTSLRAD